ncbi:MAG: penicillin-binding transpeptidase domain-containing protein [Candidatus Methylomirabilis sp.]|nr:penicillin-binding transpeptidase domain-containing protein [Candidatus Methylomirabilis sp.]
MRLREALEQSLNSATVTLGERIGLDRVVEQAKVSGIESPLQPTPATLLGASEVTVLEITAAYGTLARGGEWRRPYAINKVEDGYGQVVFEEKREVRRAASPQAAFLVTSILRGTVERGTAASARRLGLTREAAGKTGTSNGMRDAWFVGYTPDLIAGVWVGIDSGAPLRRTGAQAALPIWTQFIEQASARYPPRSFQSPPGIVTTKIDPVSGLRLTPDCEGGVEEGIHSGDRTHSKLSGGRVCAPPVVPSSLFPLILQKRGYPNWDSLPPKSGGQGGATVGDIVHFWLRWRVTYRKYSEGSFVAMAVRFGIPYAWNSGVVTIELVIPVMGRRQ